MADKAGRQSPEPERAPKQVQSTTEHAGDKQAKVDAAPSATHSKDSSEETKDSLPSNPKSVMDDPAEEKVSKDGRGNIGN
ncbi:hypothetical protein MMC34_001850 [Xylographa carneopallida]|nr:hypothetical protein [Xylographa carneopallida]